MVGTRTLHERIWVVGVVGVAGDAHWAAEALERWAGADDVSLGVGEGRRREEGLGARGPSGRPGRGSVQPRQLQPRRRGGDGARPR